ncbi:MAG: PrsW family glutamic-type intramembrane protease [Patescibacteria group bacterium]
MHILSKKRAARLAGALALVFPVLAHAQEGGGVSTQGLGMFFLAVAALTIFGLLLTHVWLGVISVHWLTLHAPGKGKKPLPPFGPLAFTLLSTAAIIALIAQGGGAIAPFAGEEVLKRAVMFFGIAALLFGAAEWKYRCVREYVFAVGLGTLLTFALLGFQRAIFAGEAGSDPFAVALGIVFMALTWRMLFGPWSASIKATVLGTFILLMAVHLLWHEPAETLKAHLIAIVVAAIPAVIWCVLFLQEHRQKLSSTLLMFFAGMLSTAPILFYDMLVRSGVELQFFLFRITPESFSRSSSAFVSGSLAAMPDIRTTLVSSLVTFMIVGLIEESSKAWVTSRSAKGVVSSVDDVMQLAVIVAIGFAFAENILNPTYFVGFVQQYLLIPESPQWGEFLGNVVGRSILTSMVHILSTGVMGYFLGLAIFAGPLVSDVEREDREYLVAYTLSKFLRLPEKAVFRMQMLCTGIVLATVLHGFFNFAVTLPDLLPTHPKTIGDLLGAAPGSFLHSIAFLLVPSLFYVV